MPASPDPLASILARARGGYDLSKPSTAVERLGDMAAQVRAHGPAPAVPAVIPAAEAGHPPGVDLDGAHLPPTLSPSCPPIGDFWTQKIFTVVVPGFAPQGGRLMDGAEAVDKLTAIHQVPTITEKPYISAIINGVLEYRWYADDLGAPQPHPAGGWLRPGEPIIPTNAGEAMFKKAADDLRHARERFGDVAPPVQVQPSGSSFAPLGELSIVPQMNGVSVSLPPNDDLKLSGMELIKRFVELDEAVVAMKPVIDEAKERIEALRAPIAAWFMEQGVESIRVSGYTVYLRRQLWASYATPDLKGVPSEQADAIRAACKRALIAGLKVAEWDVPDPTDPATMRHVSTAHLIHDDYNANTLSALIRELPVGSDGEPMLPPELKPLMKIRHDAQPCKRRSR